MVCMLGRSARTHSAPEGCVLRSAFCSWRLGAFFRQQLADPVPSAGPARASQVCAARKKAASGGLHEFAHTAVGMGQDECPRRPQSRLFLWCFSFCQLIPFQPCYLMYMYPSRQGVLQPPFLCSLGCFCSFSLCMPFTHMHTRGLFVSQEFHTSLELGCMFDVGAKAPVEVQGYRSWSPTAQGRCFEQAHLLLSVAVSPCMSLLP